jgi:hypothetical protein
MTAIERRWTSLVLSSFTGSDEGFRADSDTDWFYSAKTFSANGSEKAALGLRVAVLLAYTAPMWMWGRMKTLAALDRAERSRCLHEMLAHRVFFVRELCLLLKLIACMAIFRSNEARARSGYDRKEPKLVTLTKREAA